MPEWRSLRGRARGRRSYPLERGALKLSHMRYSIHEVRLCLVDVDFRRVEPSGGSREVHDHAIRRALRVGIRPK